MWAGFADCTEQRAAAAAMPRSMESKTSLEPAQGFSVVLAKLNEDIHGEKTIHSDGSGGGLRRSTEENWMMKAGKDPQLQDLQVKEEELEGCPGFLWP